jgi:sugar transferase (PEP-CTERM system associated)
MAASSILLAILYFLFPTLIIGRGIFLITLILLPAVLIAWRLFYYRLRRLKPFRERVLIVGAGPLAKWLGQEIFIKHGHEYRIVGFLDEDPSRVGQSLVNPGIIGTYEDLDRLGTHHSIQRIIIAIQDRRKKLPVSQLLRCRFKGIKVEEGETFYEQLAGKIFIENIKPSWFIFSSGFRRVILLKLGKRGLDVLLSASLLMMLWPLFLILSALIKLDSKGPVFFRQERVGESGGIFTLLKFRSMRADAEAASGPVWASHNDSRVTRIGGMLRRFRLDELPQLINVIRGDMSFVGPRPERPYFVERLEKAIPYYSLRHTVKPGITGWAQIKYPYGSTVEDAAEKLQYDLFYIKNLSILLDVVILFETIKTVLMRIGAR